MKNDANSVGESESAGKQAGRQAGTFAELADGEPGHDAHHIPLEQRVIEQRRPHWRCWLARPHTGQVRRHQRVKRLPAKNKNNNSEKCRLSLYLFQTSFNAKAQAPNTINHTKQNALAIMLQDEYR